MFLIVFCVVGFILVVCSESKWFLTSALGKLLFVTYYQFDFDNTAACVRTCDDNGKTQSEQETSTKLLARSQFGLLLKQLNDPSRMKFHLVALHQGPLNRGTQHPLVNYADYMKTNTSVETTSNQMQQDILGSFMDRCTKSLTQTKPCFTEAFTNYLRVVSTDPTARSSFHVFEMDHVEQLNRLLHNRPRKFFMAHWDADTLYYVPFHIREQAEGEGTTSIFETVWQTKQSNMQYNDIVPYAQSNLFLNQEANTIYIIREDKERYDKHDKNPLFGKQGLATFSWLMLCKITRWVVYDDERCWNLSTLQGKFVHVNSICAVNNAHWFTSFNTNVPNVLTAIGFWTVTFWGSIVYYLTYQLGGIALLLFANIFFYFVIDEGRRQNAASYIWYACLTQASFLLSLHHINALVLY